MSFRFAYSSCGWCKQAYEYVSNENLMNFRWWDKPVLPQRFWCKWSDAPPPPPNMTIQQQFMVTQTEVMHQLLQT
jgi:hypothetical protein